MAIEIERKFLVTGDTWRTNHGVLFRQGYLNRDKQRTVRVRLAGDKGFLTIKGPTANATRVEFEYEIPATEATALLLLCEGVLLEKTRHYLPMGDLVWEIDEFHGSLDGLVVAEIELTDANQTFPRPAWLGLEVTEDPRYFNSQLANGVLPC